MVERREDKYLKMLESWVDLASLKQEEGQLAQLLFDQVTDLPTVPLLFPDMRKILDEQGQLGFLYLEVVQYSAIERIYGWQTFDEIVKDIADCLLKFKQERLRQNDMMAEVMISGNAFVFVLSPPRTKEWLEYSDLDKVRKRIYHSLESFLKERLEPSIYEKFGCYIGCTVIDYDPSIRFERLVYQALDEAFADATLERERDAKKRSARLKDVIKTRKVQSVYQPILDLKDKKVIGYEALSRGPVGEFEDPDHLFKVAYEANVVWRLERLCREQALRGIAPHIKEGELLFLNVEPDAVHDPHFRSSESIAQLTECNLTPERIVLELTERMAIRDFAVFRQALEIFRSIGFKVAVDDVGCAYSGLQSIAELKPDFIKVDMSLVHGLESDSIKRDLVEAVYKFSEQIGVCLVAEGVECEEELEVIQDIGIRYAQGYFFAFPDNPPALVDWLSIGG